MNKYSKLFYDTIIFGVGNFATKLIYFFLMPIYTLALTTSDFGFVDLLNNSLQIIIPILTLCVTDGVFRFALDKDSNPELLLSSGMKVVLTGCCIVAIVGLFVASITHHTYWILFVLLYITESLKSLFAQFTRGLGMTKQYAVNGIISAIVLLVTTYLFLRVLNLRINGYLLSFIIANLFAIFYLLFIVGNYKYINWRKQDKLLLKSIIAFSLPLVPNMLSWWITNISSRYIIAIFSGFSTAGLFAAASKLPALINIIASVFQLSWQYASVKEHQESEPSKFYNTVFKYYSYLVCLSGSLLIALVPYISYFLLRDSFYSAWRYTPLLLYSAILGCYATFWGTFYTVEKNSKGIMRTTIVGAIINLALCFALIPFIDITGTLLANIVSYCAIILLRIIDYRHFLGKNVDWTLNVFSLTIILLECILLYIRDCNLTRILSFCIPMTIMILYYTRGITPWGIYSSLRK